MGETAHSGLIADLRARISAHERGPWAVAERSCLPFGASDIDNVLPAGGLLRGALHEVAGRGPELQHGTAATLFVAGAIARIKGPVLWTFARRDLFAPALAGVGLHPDRVIYAEAGHRDAVLLVVEDGLRQKGLAAVVGEIETRLSLTASRRLQLAAESTGVTAFALRRGWKIKDDMLADPSAAVTRWRIGAEPSASPLPHAPDVPGLGREQWRVDLVRSRGGESGSWMVEACDETGRLGLVERLVDGSAATDAEHRARAG